jgi:hypothetical protein
MDVTLRVAELNGIWDNGRSFLEVVMSNEPRKFGEPSIEVVVRSQSLRESDFPYGARIRVTVEPESQP